MLPPWEQAWPAIRRANQQAQTSATKRQLAWMGDRVHVCAWLTAWVCVGCEWGWQGRWNTEGTLSTCSGPLDPVHELLTRRVTRLVPHLVIEVDAKAEESGPSDVSRGDGLGKQEVGQGQGAELPQTGVEHGLTSAHE